MKKLFIAAIACALLAGCDGKSQDLSGYYSCTNRDNKADQRTYFFSDAKARNLDVYGQKFKMTGIINGAGVYFSDNGEQIQFTFDRSWIIRVTNLIQNHGDEQASVLDWSRPELENVFDGYCVKQEL